MFFSRALFKNTLPVTTTDSGSPKKKFVKVESLIRVCFASSSPQNKSLTHLQILFVQSKLTRASSRIM